MASTIGTRIALIAVTALSLVISTVVETPPQVRAAASAQPSVRPNVAPTFVNQGWLNRIQVDPHRFSAISSDTAFFLGKPSSGCPTVGAYKISELSKVGSEAVDLPGQTSATYHNASLRKWVVYLCANAPYYGLMTILNDYITGMTADDNFVWITYFAGADRKMLVLNAATGALVSNTVIGYTSYYTGIMTSDGTYNYFVVNPSAGEYRIVRVSSTGTVSTLDINSYSYNMKVYGNKLYLNGDGSFITVDRATFTIDSTFTPTPTGAYNCNGGFDIDGTYIAIVCGNQSGAGWLGTVAQFKLSDHSLVREYGTLASGGTPAFFKGALYAVADPNYAWCDSCFMIFDPVTGATLQDGSSADWNPGPVGYATSYLTNGTVMLTDSQSIISVMGDAAVPLAPRNATAFGGLERITIYSASERYMGGSKVKTVTYVATPGGASCTANADFSDPTSYPSSCQITGLTNGTAYTITGYWTNAVGDGAIGTLAIGVVPTGPPGSPTNGRLTSFDATNVTVAWDAPASLNGSTITGYEVYNSLNAKVCTIDLVNSPSAARTCATTRVAGPTYAFTIIAIGSGGRSTPAYVNGNWPTAPTLNFIMITVDTNTVGVSTQSQSYPASADLSGLTVAVSLDNGSSCSMTFANPAGWSGRTCSISGLTPNTSYVATASVTNAAGTTTTAASFTTLTSRRAGASNPVITQSGSDWNVSWTGATDSVSTLNSYSVAVNDATGTQVGSCDASSSGPSTPPGTTCKLSMYTSSFTAPLSIAYLNTNWNLTATRTSGTASWMALATATLSAPPGTVVNPTATSGDGTITVTWSAPTSGGTPDSYTVSSAGLTDCVVDVVTNPSAALSCTFTGLTNGTSYSFSVTASSSSDGDGSSSSVAATPYGLPATPTGLTATPGNGSVVLEWNAVTSLGGGTLTRYVVTAYNGAGQAVGTCTSTSATHCTITGLTNGTAYTFKVTTEATGGTSAASSPTASVTPQATAPGAPTNVTAASGNGEATVSWTAPVSDGGESIDGYIVTSSPGGLTCTAVAPDTTCTITGLTNGTAYTFTVVASNNIGASDPSSPSNSVTPAAGPSAPDRAQVTPGNHSATINWKTPVDGVTPNRYVVTMNPGGRTCTVDLALNPSAALTCTFTGLTNGVNYSFTIAAFTANGMSASDTVYATPAAAPTKPSAPRGVKFRGSVAGVGTVTWKVSGSNGGSPITNYVVYVTGTRYAKSCTVNMAANPNAALTCSVRGLKPKRFYNFRVKAVNAYGQALSPKARQAIDTVIRVVSFGVGKTTMWSGLSRQAFITAGYIKKFKYTKVTLTGYTNPGGTLAGRTRFTQQRALTVANYFNRQLRAMGVKNVTVIAVGTGASIYKGPSLTPLQRKKNRSVATLLSYK
jgi:outer membrane protein OmpA-like peptidoglycan-associated protein